MKLDLQMYITLILPCDNCIDGREEADETSNSKPNWFCSRSNCRDDEPNSRDGTGNDSNHVVRDIEDVGDNGENNPETNEVRNSIIE